MRILLTGACGRIGKAIRQGGSQAHEFVCLDMADEVSRIGGVQAPVTDREVVRRAAEGCDAIVHTAAMHGRWRNKASDAEFIETNVLGTENLFAAAIEHGIRRLVISSTLEVLCGVRWDAYGTTELHEGLPIRPDWIYPVTKAQVETLGSMYAREHGLEVAQLRYTSVSDRPPADIGLELLTRTITTADAAQANLLALAKPGLRDEVFCVGPRSPLTVRDSHTALAEPEAVLERHWPGSVGVLEAAGVKVESRFFWPVTRIDKIHLMLGFEPQTTFETYLRGLGWAPAAGEDAPGAQSPDKP